MAAPKSGGRKAAGGTPVTVALTREGVAFTLHSYDHDPAADLAGQDGGSRLRQLGKADFPGHGGQFRAVQVGFQPFPCGFAAGQRTHHRVDAVKTHTPQNKRRH